MSTSDRTSVLRQIADIEERLACRSRKLISHSIMPPPVHNDDVGHRLLEIVLPFQALAAAQIAIQDYPSPAIDVFATDDNS